MTLEPAQLATIVAVSLLAGGVLGAGSVRFLAWTDRRRADRRLNGMFEECKIGTSVSFTMPMPAVPQGDWRVWHPDWEPGPDKPELDYSWNVAPHMPIDDYEIEFEVGDQVHVYPVTLDGQPGYMVTPDPDVKNAPPNPKENPDAP